MRAWSFQGMRLLQSAHIIAPAVGLIISYVLYGAFISTSPGGGEKAFGSERTGYEKNSGDMKDRVGEFAAKRVNFDAGSKPAFTAFPDSAFIPAPTEASGFSVLDRKGVPGGGEPSVVSHTNTGENLRTISGSGDFDPDGGIDALHGSGAFYTRGSSGESSSGGSSGGGGDAAPGGGTPGGNDPPQAVSNPNSQPVTQVPEPSLGLLFGAEIIGLAFYRKRTRG